MSAGGGVWGQCPGGLLGLEKGTNCGPTSLELWLSRADVAKKGAVKVIISSQRVSVTVLNVNVLDQIIVCMTSD